MRCGSLSNCGANETAVGRFWFLWGGGGTRHTKVVCLECQGGLCTGGGWSIHGMWRYISSKIRHWWSICHTDCCWDACREACWECRTQPNVRFWTKILHFEPTKSWYHLLWRRAKAQKVGCKSLPTAFNIGQCHNVQWLKVKKSGGPLDNQTWQTELKTAPLTKVQLCEYRNQTLEAFAAASRLNTKIDWPVVRQNFSHF